MAADVARPRRPCYELCYNRSLRKTLSVLVLASAIAAFGSPQAPQNLRPQGYVNDFAGVVDAAWKQRLERLATDVEQKTGAQVAVVTVRSLEGEPIEDFTNRLFIAWGVGNKKDNKGVLLLLSIQDRRSRLEVGYGLEPIIPDGYAGSVVREMRPPLREGHYGEALYAGAYTVASRIAEKSGVRLGEQYAPSPQPAEPAYSGQYPWWLWLGAAGFLIWAVLSLFGSSKRRGRRYAWSGWAGGPSSFGGFESSGGGGGGFGGFGGGDSGGGGASSDW